MGKHALDFVNGPSISIGSWVSTVFKVAQKTQNAHLTYSIDNNHFGIVFTEIP